jgi:hypothetical protein
VPLLHIPAMHLPSCAQNPSVDRNWRIAILDLQCVFCVGAACICKAAVWAFIPGLAQGQRMSASHSGSRVNECHQNFERPMCNVDALRAQYKVAKAIIVSKYNTCVLKLDSCEQSCMAEAGFDLSYHGSDHQTVSR